MADIVIDTDVASVLQKGRAPDWVLRRVAGSRTWITFVTAGELWKWAAMRSWGEASRSGLDAWIRRRPLIPFDVDVAETWGRLSSAAQKRGRPRPQNDTWIAACCVRHQLPLLTLNARDFVDFVDDGLLLIRERG
jgi:predicted nucleic acid-binding protein